MQLAERRGGRVLTLLLLVEDNPGDVRLLREALTESGMVVQVQVVHDGEEALQLLRRAGSYATAPRPNLILLDLNLPKKSGHEVLAEVKSDPQLQLIPVVVLTSSSKPDDITKSYALGANVYLQKPLEVEEFFGAVKDLVTFWSKRASLPV
jgi:chemotaxis family two-component system response regulator Rcp1